MRVLQINNCYYRRGGADIAFLNTISLLQNKGHEVSVFSVADEKNINSADENYFAPSTNFRGLSTLEKITKTPSFLYNKRAYANLLALLEEKKPEVAHLHLFLGSLSSSILKALAKKKIPVVITVHDYRLICPAYLFLDGNNKVCEKCKTKSYLNCTINRCSEGNLFQSFVLSMDAYFRKYAIKPATLINRFIFVSDFIRKKHIEFDKVYESKEKLLYNFIPELNKIGASSLKGSYFLFYGRLSREKGVDTLLKAAKTTGMHLKIAGTGPLLDKYAGNENSNVEFLGHKTGDELWGIIKNASFVIVPSEWYENNPLTILEAYSYGKPVIGSRIGGIPEIIEEGKTGFLFEAGNQQDLEIILKKAQSVTAAEYQTMSVAARKFSESHFDPESHYTNLMQIYNEVI